jgi:hypothetical protein
LIGLLRGRQFLCAFAGGENFVISDLAVLIAFRICFILSFFFLSCSKPVKSLYLIKFPKRRQNENEGNKKAKSQKRRLFLQMKAIWQLCLPIAPTRLSPICYTVEREWLSLRAKSALTNGSLALARIL